MNLVEEAYKELHPEKEIPYEVRLKYSAKFKPYNANIKMHFNNLTFNLSRNWKTVSREIQLGLIQSLMVRLFKEKRTTTNIELYNSFIKNISSFAPVTNIDPILEQSFDRVNQQYFYSNLDKPNLKWGSQSTTKLGSYEYQTDSIIISSVFRNSDVALDYVMYHEMLHKKHKFHTKNGRSYYHTHAFRENEREFEKKQEAEAEIKSLCGYRRIKPVSIFRWLKRARNNLI